MINNISLLKNKTMKKIFLLLSLAVCFSLSAQIDPTTLKATVDTQITNVNTAGGITKAAVGGNIKSAIDYTTQQAPTKTQGNVTLSATPSVLPYDFNFCSFGNGIAYLPATTVVGKKITVFAAQTCAIRANAANTNFLTVEKFQTFTNSVTIQENQGVTFTYIGTGYWVAEFLNKRIKVFSGLISQSGGSSPTVTIGENDFTGTVTYSRVSSGNYNIVFPANSLNNSVVMSYISPINLQSIVRISKTGVNTINVQVTALDGLTTLDGELTDVPFKVEAKY